ncbi:MAG: TetR/AcrR family transcriptional regulator [Polyangiales bacterium]
MATNARAGERDVRREVLEVATRLMAARGFDGTSLQDIADEVGVSKPAVLHHYPSKEHIHQAVMQAILNHWRDTLPRVMLAATTGEDRFDAIYRELQRFFRENPDRARLLVRQGLDRPEVLREMLKTTVRPWLSAIAGYIRMGDSTGRQPSDLDAEAYAILALQLVIFSSAMGDTVSVAIDDSDEARARYYREVVRIARSSLFVDARSPEARPARGE